jgi:hypothetical protein
MEMASSVGEIRLEYGSYFRDGVLFNAQNTGFFSCLSVCLWNLVSLYANYKIVPERIDFSRSFHDFKNEDQLNDQIDIYPFLFKIAPISDKFRTDVFLSQHTFYNNSDIKKLFSWVSHYFVLADSVRALQDRFRRKYDIDLHNTLVICMRGMDKWQEIHNASPDCYYEKCEEILKKKPNLRIWIQTDQKQYLEYFLEKYPRQAFFIDELPMTRNCVATHLDRTLECDKFKLGLYLLAAMNLISCCDTIITHTGNVGYWLALFRGNTKNFYQDTTHFYRRVDFEPSGKFNCLPLRYQAEETCLRLPVLRKTIRNPHLRMILKKVVTTIGS